MMGEMEREIHRVVGGEGDLPKGPAAAEMANADKHACGLAWIEARAGQGFLRHRCLLVSP